MPHPKPKPKPDAAVALQPSALDDVIHGRLRLAVMAYLSSVEHATFIELRSLLQVTAGNLSVGLSKLDDAGYVKLSRVIDGKRTLTTAKMTAKGRKAWIDYLDQLDTFVRANRGA
jgi:DNA-binding transcriptional ArsR family regulator